MPIRDDMLKKLLLSSTASLAFAAMAPMAYAQDDQDTAVPSSVQTDPAEDDEIDEVVATGIRQAIQAARDIKRDADTAVDSITASDVSTLPDLSVAEALARVPGVVVQRVQLSDASANPSGSSGDFPSPEGGGNLVRGLTLVRSELNGRDIFSANGGRNLDFGTVPPELIGAVDVYKQTSADLLEGGLGGSVNLRTLEPFDRPGMLAVLTADGTYTDLRDEVAPDLSAVVSNRWETGAGEFGLLGSISYSELKSDLNGFQIGALTPLPVDADGNSVTDPGAADTIDRFVATPVGFQLRTNEVDRERESYYLAGQYQNNDRSLQLTAKYVRIDNVQTGQERTLEWFADAESAFLTSPDAQATGANRTAFLGDYTTTPFNADVKLCNGSNDATTGQLCETTFPATELYESGLITNNNRDWIGGFGPNFSNLGIFNEETATTEDISLNAKWRPTEQLFVNFDVHRTDATSGLERLWGGTRFFSQFELNADLDNPSIRLINSSADPIRRQRGGGSAGFWNGAAPLGPELADPANSFLLFAADELNDNDGELWAVRGDVEYEFDNDGWFDAVKFGVRTSQRDQTNRQSTLNWRGVAAPWEGCCLGYLPLDQLNNSNLYETVGFDDFFRGGVVNGENSNFLFVNREFLSNYDGFVEALAGEDLIVQTTLENGRRQFFEWEPLRQNGETDFFLRAGGISTIEEETNNAYARFDFGNEFDNGMSIDANIGVRYVETSVSTDGFEAYNFNESPDTDVGRRLVDFRPEAFAYITQPRQDFDFGQIASYDRWLPSLNVKWNLNDNHLIRFGASQNIYRPLISQLRNDRSFSLQRQTLLEDRGPDAPIILDPDTNQPIPPEILDISVSQITVTGGNPNLTPILADNFDVSYEAYWGDANQFAVSLFRKEISNNIIYASQTIGTETLDGQTIPVVFVGDVNQDEAEINGMEVSYTQFYDFLPGLLSNLGLQANYTYIDAETNAPTAFLDADQDGRPDLENPESSDGGFLRTFRYGVNNFPGLSEHAFNIIGIYQSDDVEFRLAYNWRDEYLSSYRDFVSGNPIFQTERGYLDGSFKYSINDNLQFRAQIANILDTKAKAEQQITADGQRFGRTAFVGDRRIKVGLRYQF